MAFSSVFAKSSRFDSTAPQRSTSGDSHPSTELDQQTKGSSMSPTKRRTEKWLQEQSPKKHDSDRGLRTVKQGRVVKKTNGRDQRKKRGSFWDMALWFIRPGRGRNNDREEDTLEGDTMIDDNGSANSPGYDNDVTFVEDDRDKIIKGDKTALSLRDYSHRYLDYRDSRTQDWTEEERWLFTKLTNRGYEPLLHSTWVLDYPTFPYQLFTNDESQVYINNIHSSTGRACRSLTDLIMAGSRVRDQILSNTTTEKPLFHAINKYHKWSLADGKLQHKDHIPVVAIASAKGQETVESVVGRVTDQLHALSRRYRDKWRHPTSSSRASDKRSEEFTHELPTLTGFVIKYSIVAIVTCDSRVAGTPIRTLGTFDFKVIGQDVWHALAVSIAMIRARNYLMRLDREGELGPEIVDYGSDPDA